MLCKVTLSLVFLLYLVEAELNKSKNDKFLDYGAAHLEFVPIDMTHEASFSNFNNLHLFNSNYPLIKSKSLNMTQTDSSILEKRRQKEIVTRLIDSINFDMSTDHPAGKIISADQLPQIGHKHQKIDLNTLSTYRLEFLGLKSQEKKFKFNHYIIIKKRVKKTNDYVANRNSNRNSQLNNHLNIDNSLFYTYQNTPLFVGHTLFNRNAPKRNYTANALFQQSKSLSDPNNPGQFVFCSVSFVESKHFSDFTLIIG